MLHLFSSSKVIYLTLTAFALSAFCTAEVFASPSTEELSRLLTDEGNPDQQHKRMRFDNIDRIASLGKLEPLPDEVIVNILQNFDISNIPTFSRVSKQLYFLTNEAFNSVVKLGDIFRASSLSPTADPKSLADYSNCLIALRQKIKDAPKISEIIREQVGFSLCKEVSLKLHDEPNFNKAWFRLAFLRALALPGSHLEKHLDEDLAIQVINQLDAWEALNPEDDSSDSDASLTATEGLPFYLHTSPNALILSDINIVDEFQFGEFLSDIKQLKARYENHELPQSPLLRSDCPLEFMLRELNSRGFDFKTISSEIRKNFLIACNELFTFYRINLNYANAIFFGELGIAIDPDSSVLYGNVGRMYHKLNDFNNAAKYAMKVIELNPESSSGYKVAIDAYTRLNNFELVARYSDTLIAKTPNSCEARDYIRAADTHVKILNFAKAKAYYTKAIELDPDQKIEIYLDAVSVSLKVEDYDNALSLYEALDKRGWSPRPVDYEHRAAAYSMTNQFDKALPLIKKAWGAPAAPSLEHK